METEKPRVLILADIPGWIVDSCTDQMMRVMASQFTFTKEYYTAITAERLEHSAYDADIVHLMNWGDVLRLLPTLCTIKSKLLVSVRSHRCPNEIKKVLQDGYSLHFVNSAIRAKWGSFGTVIPDGVHPAFLKAGACLNVGFVGKADSHKGIELVRQACNDLASYGVVLHEATGQYSTEEMADFYSRIDLLVMPSMSEGFFTPVFEALAMNKPVLCTKTGYIEEFNVGWNKITFIERSIDSIRSGIFAHLTNNSISKALSWECVCQSFITEYNRILLKSRGYLNVEVAAK